MFSTLIRAWCAVLALVIWSGPSWAIQVRYKATDVVDATLGVDRWQLEYFFHGSLEQFQGLTILFPADRFAGLTLVHAPDPRAFSSYFSPPGFGADGLLTLTAERQIVGETVPFGLAFESLGSAPPGAQPFEIFDADFNIVNTGITRPVPEPGSMALLAMGVAGMAWRRSRQSTTAVAAS